MPASTSVSRAPVSVAALGLALPIFTVGLFLSAFLLFAVQPMFTKFVLPRLGGSPGVWSVAMVFFQAALLAGYGYAHLIATRLRPATGVAVHLVVLVAMGALGLPIAIAEGWGRPPGEGEAFWLIGLFAVSVGPAFFAVATTGPLLQAWFARTGHAHAGDPYFLYGASNLGSFLALIAYPFLLEPALGLAAQSTLWAWGYGLLALLIAFSGAIMLVRVGADGSSAVTRTEAASVAAPTWTERARWIGLSLVPSALLVAVTAHISTDVAAAPFLWVIPLALFLLTFIITFQRKPILPHALMLRLQPILFGLPVVTIAGGMVFSWPVALGLHLSAFFVAAMVCHGELVKRRPDAAHLTDFYLCMSLGGVLGGLISGLIAPQIFNGVAEYPLLLIAALLCRPGVFGHPPATWLRQGAIAVAITIVGCIPVFLMEIAGTGPFAIKYGLIALAAAIMLQGANPVRLVLLCAATIVAIQLVGSDFGRTERVRSFYGVHKIADTLDGQHRVLFHGTTIHGAQRIREPDGAPVTGKPEPITYFYRTGPFDQVITALRAKRGALAEVAVAGLGAGSLACHAAPGETWRFYEIDPEVIDLAAGPRARFDYVNRCTPGAEMIAGDARLTLADAPDKRYDLIILDAFSSNAVPTHLLTKEAVAAYLAKLKDGGALAFNISNRNIRLDEVIANIADANGLKTWVIHDMSRRDFAKDLKSNVVVAVVAKDAADLGALTTLPRWRHVAPDPAMRTWTDDYSDMLSGLLLKLRR